MTFKRSEDGFRPRGGGAFTWASWTPPAAPRGIVVAQHGLGARLEHFDPLGSHLAHHRIATFAWNLRAQGLDPVIRRRGTSLPVTTMIEDLSDFLDFVGRNHAEVPIFLAGDSMGAQLSILAAATPEIAIRLAGLLLFVPVTALRQRNPAWFGPAMSAIGRIAPFVRIKPGWFVQRGPDKIPLARVPERQRELDEAPYRLREFSLPFLSAMGGLIELAGASGSRIHLPVAQFSAGRDLFITTAQSEAFFDSLATTDKTHFVYPEAHHDLLHDYDRARVEADTLQWLIARLPSPPGCPP